MRPLMSGVGSRETGLDSLFASKPVGPGFEPCLGQSAKLAGAPKLLCLMGAWDIGETEVGFGHKKSSCQNQQGCPGLRRAFFQSPLVLPPKSSVFARAPRGTSSEADRVWSPEEVMELKRQFEALSGRYGDLEGALTAEKVARVNVEQRLTQIEAKALQLGEEVTELRNSHQRFDISTRRASLVVHSVPESPGVDAGMPCSRSATVRASSHSHTARRSDWASHQQMLGLASRPGQGLCLSNLGLLSRSTSSCS